VGKPLVPFVFGASEKGWHELAPLVQCPKEYQFARVRGIARRSVVLKEALSVGSLWHVARAQWLADGRRGERWREALVEYSKQHEAATSKPLAPAAFATSVTLMESYVAYWSLRPTSRVLAVEYTLNPRGLTPSHPEWAWRTARLDSIEEWRKGIWIGEGKTTSSSVARVRDTYMLHGQTLLGCCLWSPREEKKFGPLAGVLLDIIVKGNGKKPPKPAERIPLPLSEMSHALKWFPRVFQEHVMQSSMIRWDDDVERRVTSCMRPYGPCDYRALCLRGQRGTPGFVFADGKPISEWKPENGKHVPPWS